MKGRLTIESRQAYEKYLADLKTRQNAVAPPEAEKSAATAASETTISPTPLAETAR